VAADTMLRHNGFSVVGMGLAGATLADVPSIALTDVNPQKVALVVFGTTVYISKSLCTQQPEPEVAKKPPRGGAESL
jgi:hypothetical protein